MIKESFMEKLLDGVEVEWRSIKDVFDLSNGYTPSKKKKEFWENGTIPWFRMEDIRAKGRILSDSIQHITKQGLKGKLIPENSLLMSTTATLGEHALVTIPFLTNQQITSFSVVDEYKSKVNIKFLFYYFFEFSKWCKEKANKNGSVGIIGIQKLKTYQIPIPPLEIQVEIVRILDTFTELTAELTAKLTAELTARKKQYTYYRDKLLTFEEGEVEWKTLGEIMEIRRGKRLIKRQLEEYGQYAVYQNSMTPLGYYHKSNVKHDTTFIISAGAAGEIGYNDKEFWAADDVYYFITTNNVKSKFLYYFLLTQQNKISSQVRRASIPRLSRNTLEKLKFPIIHLSEQARIVSILDKFDTLTSSITEGLPHEIELRQKQYEYYRDMLLSFPKEV